MVLVNKLIADNLKSVCCAGHSVLVERAELQSTETDWVPVDGVDVWFSSSGNVERDRYSYESRWFNGCEFFFSGSAQDLRRLFKNYCGLHYGR